MKIAVVGAGSTYTPELVVGPRRGCDDRRRAGAARHRRRAARGRRRAGRSGCSTASGFAATLELTDDLDRAVDGADFVLVQIRVGGQAARLHDETARSRAAASARRRRARAASRRRCAPCRSCSRSPSACASAPGRDAWIVDFTNPVGIVTRALLDAGHRAVGLCNVAIGFQRRVRRAARRRAGAGRRRPGRPQPPDVGARACGSTARTCCPRCSTEHGDELAGEVGLPRAPARGARRDAVVLPALLLRARRRARRAARRACRAPQTSPRSSASCSSSTAIRRSTRSRRCSSSAAARSTARPPSGSSRSLASRHRATSTWSTSATTARSPGSPTTTSSRCRRGSTRGGPCRSPQAPLAPELLGLASTSPPTSGSPPRRR